MSFLGREYTYVKDENFGEFIKALGLNEDEGAKLGQSKPVVKYTKDGDTYTYSSVTPGKNKVVKFKDGVEQDEEIREGIIVKSTYTVDGNTITQVIKLGEKQVTFKREFSDSELKVTMTANFWDGTAYRYYSA